jgi:hypothetical protein
MNVQEATPLTERREGAHCGTGGAPSTDERRLVTQAKSGSSTAFGELYDRHRLRIYRHLACAETLAGNNQTASSIELPGLTAWVHSVPVGLSHAGGDVHYVSVCPPPLWYRAARDEWSWLQTRRASEPGRPAGVPLGLLADVSYDQLVIKPQPGDVIVLYSDGVSEAMNPGGNELGLNGLMNMARTLDCNSPEALGTRLTSALHAFRGGAEPLDDETVIVIRRNDI